MSASGFLKDLSGDLFVPNSVTYRYHEAMTDLASRPLGRTAHKESVVLASPAIVARLQEVLGRDVVAIITGKTTRQVSRWASGDAKPPLEEQRLLRDTFQVVQLLAEVDPDEVVRAWFIGMNPQLDDAAPLEVIAEGRVRDVMAAARAFVNAG